MLEMKNTLCFCQFLLSVYVSVSQPKVSSKWRRTFKQEEFITVTWRMPVGVLTTTEPQCNYNSPSKTEGK